MSKRLAYLAHVSFEGIGHIQDWAGARGFEVDGRALYAGDPLPPHEGYDLLVVMGGPMGVGDEEEFSFLKAEKVFIREAVRLGKPVLGVCLGAQLMGEALGGRVFKNDAKEIGWFPVEFEPQALASGPFRDFPQKADVFHWHGDTFTIPPKAVRLAGSEACANQAFLYGEKALALQFHLESTPASVEALLQNCPDDLTTPGPWVETAQTIREGGPARFETMHRMLFSVLDFISA